MVKSRWILAAGMLMALGRCHATPAKSSNPAAERPANVVADEKIAGAEQAEVSKLLDQAIAEAFDGAPPGLNDAEKMKRLNWWVHTHTHLSNPQAQVTLLNTLQQRRGACGAVAYMFMEMARRMGYEAVSRGIFCLPIQGGHVVNEVKYDGTWHFFDPTFGVFFTSDGLLDSPVLAYNHLEAFPGMGGTNVFYPISAAGRQGWYYPVEPYKKTAEMYQRSEPDYLVPLGSYDIFAANNCGSTAYVPGGILTLPVTWHMAGRGANHLGTVDGSSLDVIYHQNEAGIYDSTSQYMIGDESGSLGPFFVHHRYIIDGLARGEHWQLSFHKLLGESLGNLRFTVYGGVLDAAQLNDSQARLTIDLTARAPVMEVVSWSVGEKRIQFDAIDLVRVP